MSPVEAVDRHLAAVSDHAPREVLEEVLHPDHLFREWPNAVAPTGSERDRAPAFESLAWSRELATPDRRGAS